jgi:hypothetical protein
MAPQILLLIALFSAALSLVKHRYNPQHQSLPQIFSDSLALSTALLLIMTHLIQLFTK